MYMEESRLYDIAHLCFLMTGGLIQRQDIDAHGPIHHSFRYTSEIGVMSNAHVDRLSPQERLALIGQLWDSLDDTDLAVTTAQQAELERRLASLAEDRDMTVTWEELKDELRQRRR